MGLNLSNRQIAQELGLDESDGQAMVSRGTQFSPVRGIENSPPGSRCGLFRADEAGLQLFFQAV